MEAVLAPATRMLRRLITKASPVPSAPSASTLPTTSPEKRGRHRRRPGHQRRDDGELQRRRPAAGRRRAKTGVRAAGDELLLVRDGDAVAGRRPEAHELAGEVRPADALPDAEHHEHAEEAQPEPDRPPGGQPLGAEDQHRQRQHDQRRGGVPDAGEHRLDPLLTEAEQGERNRHAEGGDHEQVRPDPGLAGQPVAQHGEHHQQGQRPGGDPVEGEVQRVQLLDADLDEQEARTPDRGERQEAGQPAANGGPVRSGSGGHP